MTGLLQRLAARATGSAWALRSDARLPFAGMQRMLETQAFEPPDWSTAYDTTQPGEGHHPTPRQVMPSAAMTAQSHTPPPDRPEPIDVQEPSDTEHAPGHRRAALTRQTQTLPQTQARPTASPGLGDTVHAASTSVAGTVTTPAFVPLAAQVPAARMAQNPAAQRDPAPLLPASPARALHTGTPRAAHALDPSRQPSPPAAEPAEVHVHIGRIEVTAIAQPPAHKPAVRERSQPLSLDAYLARRKEPS